MLLQAAGFPTDFGVWTFLTTSAARTGSIVSRITLVVVTTKPTVSIVTLMEGVLLFTESFRKVFFFRTDYLFLVFLQLFSLPIERGRRMLPELFRIRMKLINR